jgi:hypothetical protein
MLESLKPRYQTIETLKKEIQNLETELNSAAMALSFDDKIKLSHDFPLNYYQVNDDYHTQKENMTWVAASVYIAASIFLLQSDFWKLWQMNSFNAFLFLVLLTAIISFWFVGWQFKNRLVAAVLADACASAAAKFISPTETLKVSDLEVVPLIASDTSRKVPKVLADEYQRLMSERSLFRRLFRWWPFRLTFIVMLAWTIADFIMLIHLYRWP